MNPEEEHPLNALTEQTSEEERKKQVYTRQKALRTLEGDIQEAIENKNTSVASIVIAEQTKKAPAELKNKSGSFGKKIYIIIASIALVILGIGGAYYFYLQSPLAPSAPVVAESTVIPSIIAPDTQKTLEVTGLDPGKARVAVENALSKVGNNDGSIAEIILVTKAATGTESIINAGDFISLLGLSAPDILSRSLNNAWMLGTYDDNGTAAPFIILTDNFFQNAYAGMITWETTMPEDFMNIFGYADKLAEENGTDTLASYFIQGSFEDGVAENKDVRAFTQPNGTVLLLYSFINNDTIVITTDEKALAEIINRLEKQTFIR